MKAAVILGTRPELIKLAPVIHELQGHCELDVVFTGQHKELLKGLLELFEINATIELDVKNIKPNLAHITSEIIKQMQEKVLHSTQYDFVLVQGDTTTAYSVALACFYQKIPVGHIEAGLRTHDIYNPFPEELNRSMIGQLARWHFCPTSESEKNLLSEGISKDLIHMTGNTVIDSLLYVLNQKIDSHYKENVLKSESLELSAVLEKISDKNTMSLLTLHRRENQNYKMDDFFEYLVKFSKKHPNHHMIYPYHLNPKVKDKAFEYLNQVSNIHLIEPLSYRPFIYLLSQVDFIMSDSGGIQEEAPTLKKPLLVLRETTERPEVIEHNFAKLVGLDLTLIDQELEELILCSQKGEKPSWWNQVGLNPFGDGRASERIVENLLADFAHEVKKKAA